MQNNFTTLTFRQLGHILQYVHDHTGNSRQPSMLHTNNMIDELRHGASPASAVRTFLALLCDRATQRPDYPST